MSASKNVYLELLLTIFKVGRQWLTTKGVPLWVIPLALFLLVWGCSARNGGAETKEASMCRDWYERDIATVKERGARVGKFNQQKKNDILGDRIITEGEFIYKLANREEFLFYYGCVLDRGKVVAVSANVKE